MLKNKRLLTIFTVIFFDILAATVIFFMLPLYVEKLGFSPTVIGLLLASYPACSLIAVPILGHWSDQWGRRRILLICQVGTFLSVMLLLFVKSPFLIFLAVMLDGFTGGNRPIAEAYVADVTEPGERVEAFRRTSMIGFTSLALGPFLGALLAAHDLRGPIAAGGVFSLLAIIVNFFFLPNNSQKMELSKQNEKRKFDWTAYRELMQAPHIRSYLIQFAFYVLAFTIYVSGLALFLEHRFQWDGKPFGGVQISYVLTTIGVYTVLFQGFILARLQKIWGEIKFLKIAFCAAFVGYFLLGSIQEPLLLLVVLMFTVFGNSSIPQTLTGMISRSVPDTRQGKAMGVLFSMRSCCEVVLPPLAGYLIERGLLSIWAWIPCLFYFLAFMTNMKYSSKASSSSSSLPPAQLKPPA